MEEWRSTIKNNMWFMKYDVAPEWIRTGLRKDDKGSSAEHREDAAAIIERFHLDNPLFPDVVPRKEEKYCFGNNGCILCLWCFSIGHYSEDCVFMDEAQRESVPEGEAPTYVMECLMPKWFQREAVYKFSDDWTFFGTPCYHGRPLEAVWAVYPPQEVAEMRKWEIPFFQHPFVNGVFDISEADVIQAAYESEKKRFEDNNWQWGPVQELLWSLYRIGFEPHGLLVAQALSCGSYY